MSINCYVFGFNPFRIDPKVQKRIVKAIKDQKVDQLITKFLQDSGSHIQSFLTGKEESLEVIRKRHLKLITKLFSADELSSTLKLELKKFEKEVIQSQTGTDVVADGDSWEWEEITECSWWWCYDSDDEGDEPDLCVWNVWCDQDGEPLDEEECGWFNEDGEGEKGACEEPFLCC